MAILSTFIVEDSAVIRENLVVALEEMASVQVMGHAEDEASAVRWLQNSDNDCQLGIVDVFLKSGSGLGVLQAMRDSKRGIKLVVLSNFATPQMRHKCLELGADRVFDKSHEIDALVSYCEALAASIGGASSSAGQADL